MENRIFIDDDFIQKCYTDFIASQIEDKLKLCDFSQPITFNNFEQTIIAPMIDNNEEIQYFNGATKGVIKFLNKQYVLKIPFYNEKEPIWDKCNKEMQREWKKIETGSVVEDSVLYATEVMQNAGMVTKNKLVY